MAHLDLHLHTTFSDGTWAPEEVVHEAAKQGVTLIAITDHDDIGGILPAQSAGREVGVQVIAGVEINTEIGREEVHILGYGFPADSSVMQEGLQHLRESRVKRMRLMLERLAALGYPISEEAVMRHAGQGSVGRPHVGMALVEAGFVSSLAEAFDRLIGNRGPAYVRRETVSPQDAIELIHRAGGITSLAHPGKLGDPVRIIRLLCAAGLDALEAYHSDHLPSTTERMLKYAATFRLGITGGSDSHGPRGTRPIRIGNVPIPDELIESFRVLLTARKKQ